MMRAPREVGNGGGDRVQSAERGASDIAISALEDVTHLAMVVMRDAPESSDAVSSLVELIEELHRASSEAAAHGFPLMAQRLDECGFAFASELADDRSNERALVEGARRCLETWRAMREW
jgi:hypothetical protein